MSQLKKNSSLANNIESRINTLIRKIRFYSYMLHVKGETLIDDAIYDSMRRELESLEEEYPKFLRKDSPSLYVSLMNSSAERIITHTSPMLSLRHTYNYDELNKIIENFFKIDDCIIVEPKIDGVALSLIYEDGFLDSISLRGDGEKGEDITHMIPYIENISMQIENFTGNIRGEVICPKHIIKDNNRNYVSGALRKKYGDFHNLFFYPYYVKNSEIFNQQDAIIFLQKYFKISYYEVLNNIENLKATVDKVQNYNYDFFIDGVVLKLNNFTREEGFTNRYPKNAIAFKFTDSYLSTFVKDIQWNINRSGFLIPLIHVNTIEINGSKIKKIHGHNKKYLLINKISKNAKVNVARVANVIPQITHVIEAGDMLEPLTHCPYCKEPLEESEIHYMCKNISCVGILNQRNLYFFQQLNIKGLGQSTLEKLINKNTDIVEILKDLESYNWVTSLNHRKIAITLSSYMRNISLIEILTALGIENVSKASLNKIENLRLENLEDLKGIVFKDSKKFNNLKMYLERNQKLIENTYNLCKSFKIYS
jgi:DNA ligase (NAD+)